MEGKIDEGYLIGSSGLRPIRTWRAERMKCQQPFALGSEPLHVSNASQVRFGSLCEDCSRGPRSNVTSVIVVTNRTSFELEP